MKLRLFTLSLLCLSALMGADKPAAKKQHPAPAKSQPMAIPADAVEIAPYTYRYTDAKGKKWIYQKTPFGVTRTEDSPASSEAAKTTENETARLIASTTAIEDGDTIRFERPLPFGVSRWQRKKTELNEVERAVWERELQKRAARESASNPGKD